MMKYSALALLCLLAAPSRAQRPAQLVVRRLSLPQEIADANNQFSGLYIQHGNLYLLAESRLQEKAEGKLYRLRLADLDRKLTDTAYVLPYQKYRLHNLAALQARINAAGQLYEGLEALLIDGDDDVYLSVETATASANCYLLRGTLTDTAVTLNPEVALRLPKPTRADGASIYNAGFEAVAKRGKQLVAFFEYNYFSPVSYAYPYAATAGAANAPARPVPVAQLPFRITDITRTKGRHFTAINYFYQGGGPDTVYRTPAADAATALILGPAGYRSYCRLIDVTIKKRRITWQPLWEFPGPYRSYNWEGIAAYNHGYFIINDKYTPGKPLSTLLYLEPQR